MTKHGGEDSRYLTDKKMLPIAVTELRFGDAGDHSYVFGYHTLGNCVVGVKVEQRIVNFRTIDIK